MSFRVLVASLLVATAALFAVGTTLEGRVEVDRPATSDHNDEGQETLFQVDLETPLFVVVGVAVSLVLAALVWFRRKAAWFGLAAVFSFVFAVLDVREVLHQIDEQRLALTVITVALTLGHLAVAVLGARAARSGPVKR